MLTEKIDMLMVKLFRKFKTKNMKIYIASSWRNQHGVEMLTYLLRKDGHEVISWVENNYGEMHNHITKKFDFETWVNSEESDSSFNFDTKGATECDLLIYYAPSGKDACCELGAAWGAKVPIFGLYAKGEDLGLMRKMMTAWYTRYTDLLIAVEEFNKCLN
jgi:hypothetical protein